MRVVLSLVVLGGMAASSPLSLAQQPQSKEPVSSLRADPWGRWLAELDHEEFARREAAAQHLRAAGSQAIEALAAGSLAESPEVAWRSGEILKQIALDGDEATLERVVTALAAAGTPGRSDMQGVIAGIRARLHEVRRERAVAAIRQHGGQISSNAVDGGLGFDVGFLPVMAAPIIIEEEELAIDVVELEEAAAVEAGVEAAEAALEAARADAKTEPAESSPDLPAQPAPSTEVPPGEGLKLAAPAIDLDAVVEKALRAVPKIDDAAMRAALEETIDEGAIVLDEPVFLAIDAMAFAGPAIAIEAFPAGGVEGAANVIMYLSLDANWRGGDEGLAVIADLPEITAVTIGKAKLSDKGLRQIAKLPRLSSLTITETPFSLDALRALHREKPNMSLFCQGSAMLGIHADRGGDCTLTSVYPGSGAADAGLQTGDKIVTIDGVEIRDFAELTISVYSRKAGEKLQIAYEREGKQNTATVLLKPRAVLEP